MKKFYLSVQQRRDLINLALEKARKVEDELKEGKVKPGPVLDACEAGIQEYRMLAALLKVDEMETD